MHWIFWPLNFIHIWRDFILQMLFILLLAVHIQGMGTRVILPSRINCNQPISMNTFQLLTPYYTNTVSAPDSGNVLLRTNLWNLLSLVKQRNPFHTWNNCNKLNRYNSLVPFNPNNNMEQMVTTNIMSGVDPNNDLGPYNFDILNPGINVGEIPIPFR